MSLIKTFFSSKIGITIHNSIEPKCADNIDIEKEVVLASHFVFPPRGEIVGEICNIWKSMEKKEMDYVYELYRVWHDVVLFN